MNLRILFFCAFTFISCLSTAEFLNFPLGKNGVKIFPQRFEYHLLDKDHFQIGDIIIDFTKLDFQLIPANKKQTEFRVRFHWPANLISEGQLMITDNSGKSLLDEKINADNIHTHQDAPNLGYLDTSVISEELWEKLRFTAFFKFCVIKSDDSTKIYLCSKDLYVQRNADGLFIRTRDSLRTDSFIEINGRPVDPQGSLFLNSRTDIISLKANLDSGASIEIFTRMKDVFFKDIFISDDSKKITIRASGAEPVRSELTRYLENGDWEITLSDHRPTLFLRGEGGIPLRQEFLITKKLPLEKMKVDIFSGWQEATYTDSIELNLKQPSSETHLRPLNKGSSLNESLTWRLQDLAKGQDNERDLEVSTSNEKFIACHHIARGYPSDLSVHIGYPATYDVNLKYQLPDLRFGILGTYSNNRNSFDLGLSLRKNKGLYLVDESIGLSLISRTLLGEPRANQILTSFWLEKKAPRWLHESFSWWINKLHIPLTTSSSDSPLKNVYQFDSTFRKFKTQTQYYDLGLQISANNSNFYGGWGILF